MAEILISVLACKTLETVKAETLNSFANSFSVIINPSNKILCVLLRLSQNQ